MEKQRSAYLYALIAVLFWSTSASAFKICLSPEHLKIPVLPLLFGASLVASAALLIHLLISGKVTLLKTISKSDIIRSAFLGFLSPFLYYTVLF
ncbi:MAG: EamA family transporter, partial [Planctomycetota bacterium]